MKISKLARTELVQGIPSEEQLRKVNLQSKKELTAEEVYVFSVRLCDDQVDRDGEKFAVDALPQLAKLFIGKPGIVDHNWSAEKQAARIFDTEVVRENGVSYLLAWAYIPRSGREQLICDIESGIRREVSISCSMGRKVCSVCGESWGSCCHRAGTVYDGKRCVGVLTEPLDAYEFSFVAVPAQPLAGVQKKLKGGEEMELEDLMKSAGKKAKEEFESMKLLAEYGRQCREADQAEALRMAGALNLGLSRDALEPVVKGLGGKELRAMLKELRQKMEETFLPRPQLSGDTEAYLI